MFEIVLRHLMANWRYDLLDVIQILAGCDYLDSIPGIGIKTAHKLLRKHKSVEKASHRNQMDRLHCPFV